MINSTSILNLNRVPLLAASGKKPRLLFLSGPGGVGKTTVGNKIIELTKQEANAYLVASSTRKTYERIGVATERDARALGVDKLTELQEAIFEDYCLNITTELHNATNRKEALVVIDRTPYDHASYLFQQIPSLNLDQIKLRMDKVRVFMENLDALYPAMKHVVMFPYPRPWSIPEGSADGQRANMDAKTYTWSLALQQMTENELPKNSFYLHELTQQNLSVEGTARYILEEIERFG